MGWQCAVQVLQLVRGDGMRREGNGRAKDKANVAAIVNEAFLIADPNDGHPIPYRKSASETYDRSRTHLNEYEGPKTADGVLEVLEEEAAKRKIKVHTVDKKTGETVVRYKALQSNTPLGVAVIFNPPGAVTRDWTPEKHAKFISDCEECLAKIPLIKLDKYGRIAKDKDGNPVDTPHYIFRKENRIARAGHWDESEPGDPPVYSPNWHEVYIPPDQDDKYCGSMVDALWKSVILNRMFPRLMREKGWDIDETKHTDWAKFHEDEEYRAETKARIKKGGRSVNQFRADKKLEEAEATLKELASMAEQMAAVMEDVTRREQEADEKVRAAEEARQEAEANREKTEAELEQAGAVVEQATGIMEAVTRREQEADEKVRAAEESRRKEEDAREKAVAEKEEAIAQKDQAIEARRQADEERDSAIAARDEASEKQQIIQMGTDLLVETRKTMQQELTDLMGKQDAIKKQVTAAVQERDKARMETEEAVRKKTAVLEETASAIREQDAVTAAAAEARKGLEGLENTRKQLQTETETLTAKLEAVKKEIAEAEQGRDAVNEEMRTVKTGLATAKTQVQEEIKEYRQGLMDQAKEDAKAAAKAEQARIEAAAREAWEAWLEDRKRKIEEKAAKIIQDAKDKAADILAAATGEHGFLIRWLSSERFTIKDGSNAGKTYLDIARAKYQKEVREKRLAEHSQATKDAVEKSQQQQADGKGLGE